MSKIEYSTYSIEDLNDIMVEIADILVERTKDVDGYPDYKWVRERMDTNEQRKAHQEDYAERVYFFNLDREAGDKARQEELIEARRQWQTIVGEEVED
jgi:hypothetical protein